MLVGTNGTSVQFPSAHSLVYTRELVTYVVQATFNFMVEEYRCCYCVSSIDEDCQRMMDEAKGPFPREHVPDEQADVWDELEDQDKYESDQREVFLSYHADRLHEAQELSKYLDAMGFEVLVDFRYQREITILGDIEWREQCLKMARKIVVLCSPGYKKACDSTRRFVGRRVREDDRAVLFDYNYIVTDISRNFVNKKMMLLRTETGPPDDCVPHQFLNYPPILWRRSKGEDPVKLNYALWDTPQYEKPKVKPRIIPPRPIKETFNC